MSKDTRELGEQARQLLTQAEAAFSRRLNEIEGDYEERKRKAASVAAAKAAAVEKWYQQSLRFLDENRKQAVDGANKEHAKRIQQLKKEREKIRRELQGAIDRADHERDEYRQELRKEKTEKLRPIEEALAADISAADEWRGDQIAIAEQDRLASMAEAQEIEGNTDVPG